MAATQASRDAHLGDTFGRSSLYNRALFTDLYELTMAQAYQAERMDQLAVFELAFREMCEYTDFYPTMANTAREEGSFDIAKWFETLSKAEESDASRFSRGRKSHG